VREAVGVASDFMGMMISFTELMEFGAPTPLPSPPQQINASHDLEWSSLTRKRPLLCRPFLCSFDEKDGVV
jgi:hypothetical protein